MNQQDHQYAEVDKCAILGQQKNTDASTLQPGLNSDTDFTNFSGHEHVVQGARNATEEVKTDNQDLNSNVQVCFITGRTCIFPWYLQCDVYLIAVEDHLYDIVEVHVVCICVAEVNFYFQKWYYCTNSTEITCTLMYMYSVLNEETLFAIFSNL